MRQRLQKFLPIVLIALVVQILAPIGATWAAALAAADPSGALLGAVPICHSGPAAPTPSDQGGSHSHDGACAVCCVAAQAGASLDTPKPQAAITPYRVVVRVIWHDEAVDLAPHRAGSNAQARAPPLSM